MKVRGDEQSVTNSGKLFCARGPATTKVLSPSDERVSVFPNLIAYLIGPICYCWLKMDDNEMGVEEE